MENSEARYTATPPGLTEMAEKSPPSAPMAPPCAAKRAVPKEFCRENLNAFASYCARRAKTAHTHTRVIVMIRLMTEIDLWLKNQGPLGALAVLSCYLLLDDRDTLLRLEDPLERL